MPKSKIHIEVAVALPVHGIFSYAVPNELSRLIETGKRILVPFGRRRVTGYVLEKSPRKIDKPLKNILDILDNEPLFPANMVPFFKWISDYYIYPIGQVIQNALPGGLTAVERNILTITPQGINSLEHGILTPTEKQVLTLLKSDALDLKGLQKKIDQPIAAANIFSLVDRELIATRKTLKGGSSPIKTERFVRLSTNRYAFSKLSKARQKIVACLESNQEASLSELKKILPTAPRLIKSMAADGQVHILSRQVFRDPFGQPVLTDSPPVLTAEQQVIVEQIGATLDQAYEAFLIDGVTGSGKTEVYLQLAQKVIDRRQSAIILVPEIALISQMEQRFRARFENRIAILHSGLSRGERYDQWLRIVRGDIQIAIGARSAIFAPFENLGLLVVDEEHDTSYKQESSLRYNARDLATLRAKQCAATVVLGSATPSIQSYHNAVSGKYKRVSLPRRIKQRPLPQINIVDLSGMRDQRGVRRYFSKDLLKALENTMQRNEQAILFLNRRGFANLPICDACGQTLQCKNCDIAMTYHQKANAYRCHYCGFSRPASSVCPSCKQDKIRNLGFGTEKIEQLMQQLYPHKQVVRMDRDTITHKGSILKILTGLKNGQTDILIGTQLVAKGHDYPNITLVGIICADLSLSFPDFRAGEQTFQLLAQVSGRAGRGDRPGHVILQTYNPDHFSIQTAQQQNVQDFYNQEIIFRKALSYPPFSRMIQIIISGRDKDLVNRHARTLGDTCHILIQSNNSFRHRIEIMGPIEAPFARIAANYRWQILFKGHRSQLLHQFLHQLINENPRLVGIHGVKVVIDVDPVFMM